jgi:mRNA interferase ChpB
LKRGDILFASLEPAVGREQRGLRPVFVLTSERFNRITGTAIIAAITNGGQFARRNGLTVDLPFVGTKTTGTVRCEQIRTLDLTSRNARFVESASEATTIEVLERVRTLIDLP